MSDAFNALNAMKDKTEEQLNAVLQKDDPNEDREVNMEIEKPNITEIKLSDDVVTAILNCLGQYFGQVIGLNASIIEEIKNQSVKEELMQINSEVVTSRNTVSNEMQAMFNMLGNVKGTIVNGINALGDEMVSQGEYAKQIGNLQTQMIGQIGVNSERLLDQQGYTNKLLEYNVANNDDLRNTIYTAYKALCDRAIGRADEQQKQLLANNPEQTMMLIEDANEIIPTVIAHQPNIPMEQIEYLRDQYVFFMNIISNYIMDQNFINLSKELGFAKMFNAYLQRGVTSGNSAQSANNEYLTGLFTRMSNHVEILQEEYQTIRDAINNLPNNLPPNMDDIISKCRTRVRNMWNIDSNSGQIV